MAIEPVYKHIVWNAARAREVLDRIGSPNLQIIFDPVNLLHPDNLDHRDEVIQETIEVLGPDICMLHLKDYVTADDGRGGIASPSCRGWNRSLPEKHATRSAPQPRIPHTRRTSPSREPFHITISF
jgi:sugar phosphate isomerase/epimerase